MPFRAINRPSPSPLKLIYTDQHQRSTPCTKDHRDDVLKSSSDHKAGAFTKNLTPRVVIPTRNLLSHEEHNVLKPSDAIPSSSISSHAHPSDLVRPCRRRKQPDRDAKPFASIEENGTLPTSPAWAEPYEDFDWQPSKSDLSENLSYSGLLGAFLDNDLPVVHSSKSALGQKVLGKPVAVCSPMIGSPLEDRSYRTIKKEKAKLPYDGCWSHQDLVSGSLTPTIDQDLVQKRLDEHGFIELPESDAAFLRWQDAKKQEAKKIAGLEAAYLESLERENKEQKATDCCVNLARIPEDRKRKGNWDDLDSDVVSSKATKGSSVDQHTEHLIISTSDSLATNKSSKPDPMYPSQYLRKSPRSIAEVEKAPRETLANPGLTFEQGTSQLSSKREKSSALPLLQRREVEDQDSCLFNERIGKGKAIHDAESSTSLILISSL